MGPTSVNSLVFYVSDAAATKAFYDRLGFFTEVVSDDYFRAKLKNIELEFHDIRTENIEEFLREGAREPKGAGVYFYCRVQRLEEYRRTLIDAGVETVSQIVERPWGNLEFSVKDPDGYSLMFYRRPA